MCPKAVSLVQGHFRNQISPFSIQLLPVARLNKVEVSQDSGIVERQHNATSVLKCVSATLNETLSIIKIAAT
jgi:hypothetical protein